jgi:2-polyprenyl-3-methyl-5-hydroxy-6-metoxy-1,4-benzoquinol methylase
MMDTQSEHWEEVYKTKAQTEVSWYRPHLETSLALIERVATDRSVAILDVGGGESTLVDDLILCGYTDVSVLDISQTAVEVSKQRLGAAAARVEWRVGNICETELPSFRYDIWHDRAVFHFLTSPEQRAAYMARAAASVKMHGHLILSTFGPEGPTRCSGLNVVRYGATGLQAEVGAQFCLVDSQIEWHATPSGGQQQFLYSLFERL